MRVDDCPISPLSPEILRDRPPLRRSSPSSQGFGEQVRSRTALGPGSPGGGCKPPLKRTFFLGLVCSPRAVSRCPLGRVDRRQPPGWPRPRPPAPARVRLVHDPADVAGLTQPPAERVDPVPSCGRGASWSRRPRGGLQAALEKNCSFLRLVCSPLPGGLPVPRSNFPDRHCDPPCPKRPGARVG